MWELKDTFKVLQEIKRTYKNEDRNCQIRTTSNPTISTKNDVIETSFVNGAGDVLFLENVKKLLNILKSNEYEQITSNLYKLVA